MSFFEFIKLGDIVYYYPFCRFDSDGLNEIITIFSEHYKKDEFTLIMLDNFTYPSLSKEEKESSYLKFINELGVLGYKLNDYNSRLYLLPALSDEIKKITESNKESFEWMESKSAPLKQLNLSKQNIHTKERLSINLIFMEMDAFYGLMYLTKNAIDLNIILKYPGFNINQIINQLTRIIKETNSQIVHRIYVDGNHETPNMGALTINGIVNNFTVYHVNSFNEEIVRLFKIGDTPGLI
jgi:hypothetical protein